MMNLKTIGTKCIVCDVDGVLTKSRTAAEPDMIALLRTLIGTYRLILVSGGNQELINKQIIEPMDVDGNFVHCLSCLGQVYTYAGRTMWTHKIAEKKKRELMAYIKKKLKKNGYDCDAIDMVEDRGSSITISLLGRDAALEEKERFDKDKKKRIMLKRALCSKLGRMGFKVTIGGTTSLDVTEKGRDKGSGIKKLLGILKIDPDECVYIGDHITDGGNDYPATRVIKKWFEARSIKKAYDALEWFL